MAQVTWRASDELVERVRQVAADHGRSMNDFLSQVLAAATDPDNADDEASRVRERLARAGLLTRPASRPRRGLSATELSRSRKAAGKGTPLATIVSRDRG